MRHVTPSRVLFAALCLTIAAPAVAQQVTFDKVKIRFQKNATDRRLVYKDVDLIFDDHARRMVVRSKDRPLDVSYADVDTVIVEVTTHMRGGGGLFGGGAIGGLVGGLIAGVGLIRFGGYLPKGEYDVDHDGDEGQADAAELHG